MKKQILTQLQAIKKLSQKFNLSGQLLIERQWNQPYPADKQRRDRTKGDNQSQ